MESSRRRATTNHVAVFAFPFGSHAASLLTLVRRLSEATPDVRFSFLSTVKSNASIFPRSSGDDDNIKPYDVDDGLPVGYEFKGNHLEMVELFLKVAPESFKTGMEAARAEIGEEIGCLISDAFLWFVGDMAKEMKVPWLPIWTSGPRPLLVHVETDLIREKIKSAGGSGEESQSLDFLPGFSALCASDLPEEVVSMNLDSPFANMAYKMGQYLPLATAVIINSFEELELEVLNTFSSRFKKFLNIGPFNLLAPPPSFSDEHGCIRWLDQQTTESVVYIAFGRFLSPPPHELAELAEALEESGFPYLWSFRGNAEENLPKGFLGRANGIGKGKIVPWAPQSQVLKHSSVGVFVTHGGWNSVLESIAGGVTMICRPIIGDQTINVKTVEAVWGIGVGLEGGVITKSGVLKALEQVLGSGKGKKMRERVEVLRGLAHEAVESTGSSSRNFNSLVEIVTI